MPLKRGQDRVNLWGIAWQVCDPGDVPEAIACERINPGEYGNVAIIEKIYSTDYMEYPKAEVEAFGPSITIR